MAINAQPRLLTVEEYLAFELQSEVKHEYHAGHIFAMAGASPEHVYVSDNVFSELRARLDPARCRAATNDLRIYIEKADLHTYADVSVTCGEPRYTSESPAALLNPKLIVEVLSPSTEAYDRGQKFEFYKTVKSLEAYLLVAQDRAHATLYSREVDHRWVRDDFDGLDAAVRIDALGIELSLAAIYAGVVLPSGRPPLGQPEE